MTNITYNNSTVYNHGPDYNRLNQYSARPIQRLTLQRETTGSFGHGDKRGTFNRVNGGKLAVVAPVIQKSPQQIARNRSRRKSKPKVERGWQGVQNRKQLQDEMKKEDAKSVRPPSFPPQKDGKREAVAADQNADVQPNEARQENGRERTVGLQTARRGGNRTQTEWESGMKDMAADKDKKQQNAEPAQRRG